MRDSPVIRNITEYMAIEGQSHEMKVERIIKCNRKVQSFLQINKASACHVSYNGEK